GAGNPADAAFAGCDMPTIVDQQFDREFHYFLEGYDILTPVERLQENGFILREAISEDFNGDGAAGHASSEGIGQGVNLAPCVERCEPVLDLHLHHVRSPVIGRTPTAVVSRPQ
ncbi:MAG: hypothetical protein AAFW98_20090, partial [Pseudomonadota bacterium]